KGGHEAGGDGGGGDEVAGAGVKIPALPKAVADFTADRLPRRNRELSLGERGGGDEKSGGAAEEGGTDDQDDERRDTFHTMAPPATFALGPAPLCRCLVDIGSHSAIRSSERPNRPRLCPHPDTAGIHRRLF